MEQRFRWENWVVEILIFKQKHTEFKRTNFEYYKSYVTYRRHEIKKLFDEISATLSWATRNTLDVCDTFQVCAMGKQLLSTTFKQLQMLEVRLQP